MTERQIRDPVIWISLDIKFRGQLTRNKILKHVPESRMVERWNLLYRAASAQAS